MRSIRHISASRPAARLRLCITVAALSACAGTDSAPRLVLGATHTIEDTGLLDALARAFEAEHGTDHRLSIVVAGSGEIIAMARHGDIDVLITHSPDAEAALVADGRSMSRFPLMYNDFIIVGPAADPAAVRLADGPADALRRIADGEHAFISRGDESGTHAMERRLLAQAGIAPGWEGHVEAGTGMAESLRLASQRAAYSLSDRATFTVLGAELQLEVVHEDSAALRNPYSVIVVRDAQNEVGGRMLAQWLRGARARSLIASWGVQDGAAPLFIPAEPQSQP